MTYSDGVTPVSCRTKSFIDVDMTASVKVADKFTLYTNVLNLFNAAPPFDPSAGYSTYQFNPAWAGAGFVGRYFRCRRQDRHLVDRNCLHCWCRRLDGG